ncbi:MAG TPA: EAL domain-containing protein [Nautiliaceae bacterium]|nr:EAL domain-containing protein [Nautiliaceae bacterium]
MKTSNIIRKFIHTAIIGLLLGIAILFLLYKVISRSIVEQEIQKARLVADTIVYYRQYLSVVAPKVKILDKNLSPFAVTPAYTTNQVAKMLRENGEYVRQVSDQYRNPLDKPTQKELEAINFFKKHKNIDELWEVHLGDEMFNKKHIFYARKLIIEKSCLKCHGVPLKDVPEDLYKKIVEIYGDKAFNYKEGEVRGIVSIVFPYEKIIYNINKIFVVILMIGATFFIVGLLIFFRLNKNIKKDIEKILDSFSTVQQKGIYPYIKEKMDFIEFEILKNKINDTFKILKKFQGENYKKLYFHPLTNLYNRNKFLEDVKKRDKIIVLINIDKFKDINFYFGQEIADKLIVKMASRLKQLKKEFDFKLFHIDIDEFALLFDANLAKEELILKVKEIIKNIEKPYIIDDNEILLKVRVGISFDRKDYIKADIALDMAKELKKDIVFGQDILDENRYKNNLEWLKKIKYALKNDRIVPFYQPIVDKNKNIIKYEALVRLIDEDGKVVSPFFFLDIAKKSRLYLDITKRVITKVVEQINQKDVNISVNLTLEDIESVEMRKFILEKVDSLEDKSKITFEIVESEDVRENKIVKEFLKILKEKGCSIYIDDFGSGYSNFDYILKLYPDGVKIDGSLIKNILEDKNSKVIVKTVVSFAKGMKIKTVAEFVENEEIFNVLKEMGIDYFQGYYFSHPKPTI